MRKDASGAAFFVENREWKVSCDRAGGDFISTSNDAGRLGQEAMEVECVTEPDARGSVRWRE